MRERGVQSRRVRDSKEAVRRPAPASSSTNIWQVIAIVALLAATAGWTTVAVITLRGSDTAAAVASPTDSAVPLASDIVYALDTTAQSVALVGATASGKSTAAKLVARFYERLGDHAVNVARRVDEDARRSAELQHI